MPPRAHNAGVRLLAAGLLLFAAYAGFVTLDHLRGQQRAAIGDAPLFTDFTSTYAGSVLLRYEPAANLYVPERMLLAEYYAANAAYDFSLSNDQIHQHSYAAWMYPPPFSFVVLPLARLPYLWAFALWTSLGLLLYLAGLMSARHRRASTGIGLAAPPTLFNLGYGQTGFLSAGLIGLGLNLMHRHPTLAGAAIGLAVFKPHLGLLIPLALLAGGYWWVFISASTVALALTLSSGLAFGWDHWSGFFASLGSSLDGIGRGAYLYQPMVTLFGWAKFYGASNALAWGLQLLAGSLSAGLVIWGWRGARNDPSGLPLRAALLCSATLLAIPLAYFYDLTLLSLALCWLYQDMRQRGGSPRGYAALGLTGLIMLALYPAVWQGNLHLGPLPALLLTGLSAWRLSRV